MEKFAIDLDKVLDDFEFNEDCAEQIASVNSPLSNVPSSTGKCSLEPTASKPYSYLASDYKTSKEYEIVPSLEAHSRGKHSSERDAYDDPEYGRNNEPVHETADSVNHFYTHECVTDVKIGQKQTVPSCEPEQPSLTIYNDISQKLLQKQQNGSGSPKIDNRYDKKLNQPNIKPSVSNVFNSLNEYINAPPGSLDYVHAILDKQDVGPNVDFGASQEAGGISAKGAIVKHSTLVNTTTQEADVSIAHEASSSRASIAEEAFLPDYRDDVVPVTLGTFVAQEKNVADETTNSVVVTSSESGCKSQASANVTVTVLNANDTQYEYKDVVYEVDASSIVGPSTSIPSVECGSASVAYASQENHEDICDNVDERDSRPSSEETAYESIVQDTQSAENVVKKTVVEIRQSDGEASAEVQTFNISSRNCDAASIVRKPLGFSSIHDLSEEELSTYLAELEQEEQLKETKSKDTVLEAVSESTSEERKDEDAHEAPIFENVIIGELPRISREELSRKAKKFPVIDYEQEQSKEADRQSSQESGNEKTDSERNELESSEEARETLEKTSELFEDVKRAGFDEPSVHEESRLIVEKENVADNKHTQRVDEHYTYEDESLSRVKPEVQSNDDVGFSSVQYDLPTEPEVPCEVDSGSSTLQGDRTAETESSTNEINAELEKPARPQTLDIVLADHADDHQTLGTASATPSDPLQSETDVIKDDCQGSSPDALENSTMESSSALGKQPPFWVPDSDAPSCMLCEAKFTVLKRRHHCRACGKVLCNKCCSMKYKLEYQGNIDSRVCVSCYQLLTKAESEQGTGDWSSGYTSYMSNNDINSPQGKQPNPNNPMEYCSTIPPLQQLVGGLPPPPTVMVPVGVLKREGGTKNRPEGAKSVMFSDELDMSWDLKPPYRKPTGKRIPTPGSSLPVTATKRQNQPRIDPSTSSYVPQEPDSLPPTVTIHKGQVSYHAVTDEGLLYKTLKNECEPPVMFAINHNLYAYVKITNLNCCVNKICWNVTSRGLACVGQDEVILLVETLPDETRIPKDLLIFINQLYIEAIKGNTMSELGFSIYQGGNLLSSREHAGFLFIRQTLQCLQKIVLPPAPFLVGLLVHRWETPWAKVFPLRLLLRLGAEYRYYPCPLVSVRFRDALYFEIGHTVMKVLADFRNFGYTLPGVRGLTIHLRNRMTDVMFPRNRYDQVIKGLNNSNDHVLAYASNFSITADSHLVCIQTNTGDESSYQTQAINIHNKPRTVTGASFIVINGALKSSMGLSAKSSIVEDGLMVEIMPEKMEALKAALKNMQDFSIGCGRQGAPEPDETVNIKWVDNDVQFNLGVKSPIDGQLMDGIPSIRVHNGTDYKGTSRFIRWTEVFIIKSDDHPNGVHDPVDINKLSGNIAKATCTALVKLLDLLATAGLTKLGVRTTIHPDNVGYEAGSQGTKLPPIYMNSLDNELIQVLHKAAQSSQDTHTVLELIFYILDD